MAIQLTVQCNLDLGAGQQKRLLYTAVVMGVHLTGCKGKVERCSRDMEWTKIHCTCDLGPQTMTLNTELGY